MPKQELVCPVDPAALLRAGEDREIAVLLDGGGADSWGDGRARFAVAPGATLEVFASGWGRRHERGRAARWQRGSPLDQWQRFLDSQPHAGQCVDPDAGGFFTILSYDLKHWIERLEHRHAEPAGPVLFCARFDWAYHLDYRRERAWVSARSSAEVEKRVRRIETLRDVPPMPLPRSCEPEPTMAKAAYLAMIERALEYVAAGDIYQVNLAQRFTAHADRLDGAALFQSLRDRFPMPFSACARGGDWAVVSNSPECFLIVDGQDVATYPIKGTRRKSDETLLPAEAERLARDPKERAEHIMIVDLERNDLGRVCEPGTVRVVECEAVRAYPLLYHMVSEVRGRLRPGTTLSALTAAAFPGGSITGAPKIRAMEIIEELEPCSRGLYTGALGWTDMAGRSRFNLAIRTALVDCERLTYFAGGGIVADSQPAKEYEETLLKSEAFFRTLGSG